MLVPTKGSLICTPQYKTKLSCYKAVNVYIAQGKYLIKFTMLKANFE